MKCIKTRFRSMTHRACLGSVYTAKPSLWPHLSPSPPLSNMPSNWFMHTRIRVLFFGIQCCRLPFCRKKRSRRALTLCHRRLSLPRVFVCCLSTSTPSPIKFNCMMQWIYLDGHTTVWIHMKSICRSFICVLTETVYHIHWHIYACLLAVRSPGVYDVRSTWRAYARYNEHCFMCK